MDQHIAKNVILAIEVLDREIPEWWKDSNQSDKLESKRATWLEYLNKMNWLPELSKPKWVYESSNKKMDMKVWLGSISWSNGKRDGLRDVGGGNKVRRRTQNRLRR